MPPGVPPLPAREVRHVDYFEPHFQIRGSGCECEDLLTGGPGIPTGPTMPLYPRGPWQREQQSAINQLRSE